jgi:hypothetical protein
MKNKKLIRETVLTEQELIDMSYDMGIMDVAKKQNAHTCHEIAKVLKDGMELNGDIPYFPTKFIAGVITELERK